MKHFVPWFIVACVLVVLAASDHQIATARAESARLRAALAANADTIRVVDTVFVAQTRTLTRWRDSTVTLRDSLTITDTVEVVRFIAVQDSTLAACSAVVLTCAERVRLRDARIETLDSLNALTARRLSASERRGRRDRLLWAAGGAVVGWLAKP